MKKEHIIEIKVNKDIIKQIMKMLVTMDGVEGATIKKKNG